MPILSKRGLLRRLPLPALLLLAPAALAQLPPGAVVQPLAQSDDPAELLARALRTLATEPANLAALTAAGHNALTLGDPNAAVGFFGRAQEIAPSNGAVKAGLGSALVQLEKPQDALRLFAEASRLGVPDSDMAEDRGLAYDLTGQQSYAQRDYQTVLAARPDDDTARRRLALSQGISGNKAAAIATLDPLIRKRDIAGWRAQTFVLAMDGDAKGANDITRIMLPQQSAMLQPFLVKLAALSPADKARAVHFGEMPASGTAYTPTQVASVDTPATYASAPPPRPHITLAPQPAPRPSAPAATVQPTLIPSAPVPARVASAQPEPAQIAVVTPQPAPARNTPATYGPAYDSSAPLAGIALTPAQPSTALPRSVQTTVAASTPTPTPVTTGAAPASVQIAQASPPRSDLAGPPVPALPAPATEGHYDLPHDAVARAAAHPVKPAPPLTSAPTLMKAAGSPVVHGKAATSAVASADDEAGARARAAKPALVGKTKFADAGDTVVPSKARKAAVDDAIDDGVKGKPALATIDDCAPPPKSNARTKGKPGRATAGCTKLASADTADDNVTAKGKKASAVDDDCVPATKSKGRGRGKPARASTSCTTLASSDATDAATVKSRKASAAHDDCTPAPKSRSKKGKAAKPSTACTQLASASDDDGITKTAKTGMGRKAAAADIDTKATKSKFDKSTTERIYVQVAGGANKDDMDKAWAGVKKKAPDLMIGHKPLTTPLKATNRLLVGPFKDEDEAQAFVNKMAAKGLSGFTFKSGKGQKVEKIDAGG
jgi:Flp pilus assembly protein TadD